MSQTIKPEHSQTDEPYIAPETLNREEDTYNWSDQDLKRAVEILNAAPKPLTPVALRAKEAHAKFFGTSR